MAKTQVAKAAAVYTRISHDARGEGLGVQRQQELCEELAAEKGWTIAEVYVDNDVSAYNGKRRAAYERMLADLEAGRRDALVVVDADRLTRRPIELERVIELADEHGIAMATVGGDLDLASSDGRLRARIMGAVARQESERKGERVSREAEQAAHNGVPRGSRRPFGYEEDKVTIRPEEADLIREAVSRVLAGETVPAVCRDWNERGVETPQGAQHGWAASSLANILRNPRIAGLRAYRGEVVAEGQWDPIVDRKDWEALQGRIKRVTRVGRPSSHLLSGIARCGKCGGPLWTSWQHQTRRGRRERRPRYACVRRPGHPGCGNLTVTTGPLDELVREAVIEALSGPALAEARCRAADRGDEEAEAARDLAAAEGLLEELAADYAEGSISRREWMAAREKLHERINRASRILDAQKGPAADLPDDEEALREAWETGDVAWRRAVIGAVIDHVVVRPAAKPTPRFEPDRVEIVWRA